jgi:DNA repair/transcription protein MET18/MMS19
MKAHVQAIRHLVYQVFDSLLALHRPVFKAMGSDFLNSFTKMVDGEKDPRNLMLLFSLEKVILLEFDVKEHIEVSLPTAQPLIEQDLFDVTFCYFPISFRPPPNDPYGITAEDLKTSLRGCMSASPYFAKLALPLFLEKFTTAAGPSMVSFQTSSETKANR